MKKNLRKLINKIPIRIRLKFSKRGMNYLFEYLWVFIKTRLFKKQKKLIFIHITRTGGETIETLLNLSKIHISAKDRLKLIKNSEKYFKFAIVRNPWDRLVSWYFHLQKHLYKNELISKSNKLNEESECFNSVKNDVLMEPKIFRELAEKVDFNSWVKEILTNDKYRDKQIWGPTITQADMLTDTNGKLLVDYVGHFERYEESLSEIFKIINREDLIDKIEKTNFSLRCNYRDYYQSETIKLVSEFFKDDIILFNYKF